MRGFQFLLLSASAVIANRLVPVSRDGYVDIVEARRSTGVGTGDGYGGSLVVRDSDNGKLVRRQTDNNITEYCRFWGHSSALVNEKLYISGGISTFRENYRAGWVYLFSSAIMLDLSGGLEYPVPGDSSAFSYGVKTHASGESTQMGAFWWDGDQSIYKFGGWFADQKTWTTTPQAVVRETELWRLDLTTSSWQTASIDNEIHRAWGGAVTNVPDKKMGYFIGGIIENRTDIAFKDAPGFQVLENSFLNFDSNTASFQNKTYTTAGALDLGAIALGNAVHIPGMGKQGVLVYLGGLKGPKEQWVEKDTTGGGKVSLYNLEYVWIHDISNNRWYEQKTSPATANGQYPAGRISACSVVVPSSDKSSWNIFMFGGGDLRPAGTVYGDTWVLSLPSFRWIKLDDKGDARFEHTCHLVKGNQLLVLGGRDKQQDYAGDPSRNYTTNPADWTCLKEGIVSSLNLNTLEWSNGLPIKDEDYVVNSAIYNVIGGDASGGATKLSPEGGWSDAALGALMPSGTGGTDRPVVTPDTDDSGGGGGGGTPVGPIVGGVVGGVVVIALIAIGFILLRRSNKKKAAAADAAAAAAAAAAAQNTPQPPPVAQYDPRQSMMYANTPVQYWQHDQQPPQGYVWDPHSRQYYQPVLSPVPQSPPPGGYYKPHEDPKTGPVGQIAEMGQASHAPPQELHG